MLARVMITTAINFHFVIVIKEFVRLVLFAAAVLQMVKYCIHLFPS